MSSLKLLLAACIEFLRRHGKTVWTVLGTIASVVLVNDRNKSIEVIGDVQEWNGIERRASTRGGIDELRKKYGGQ